MSTIKLTTKDRLAIESVVQKIASKYELSELEHISVNLTETEGIVQFKSAALPLLVLTTMALAAVTSMASDPEIDDLINDIVQTEIEKEGSQLFGQDKSQYVEMIKSIVTDGAKKVVEEIKAQEQQQPAQQQPAQQQPAQQQPAQQQLAQQQPAQQQLAQQQQSNSEQPGAFSPNYRFNSELENRTKFSKTVFENIAQWGSEVGANIAKSMGDFFNSPGSVELVNRLVQVAVQKGYIPNAYSQQFTDYLNKFIQSGFQEVQTAVETQKQQEQEGGQTGDQGVETNTWKPSLTGKEALMIVNTNEAGKWVKVVLEGGINPENNTVWVWNTETNAKEWVQYETLYQTDGATPLTIDGLGANNATSFSNQESQEQQTPNPQQQEQQPQPQEQQLVARLRNTSLRIKNASEYMNDLLYYDPVSYEIVEEFLIRSGNDSSNIKRYAGMESFVDFLNTTKDSLRKLSGPVSPQNIEKAREFINSNKKTIEPFLKMVGVKSPEDLVENVDKVMGGISGVLTSINTVLSGDPKKDQESAESSEDTVSSDESDVSGIYPSEDSIIADIESFEKDKTSDYIKLNSETFLLKRGSNLYENLERIIEKTAQDKKIDNVAEIEIEITKESCEVVIRRKQAVDLLAGVAAALAGRFLGGEESVGVTGLKAVEASMTNLGAPIGQIVAKYFGAEWFGQLAAGALGAYLFHMLTHQDTPKGKAAIEETISTMSSDDFQQKMFQDLKSKFPKVPDELIWHKIMGLYADLQTS